MATLPFAAGATWEIAVGATVGFLWLEWGFPADLLATCGKFMIEIDYSFKFDNRRFVLMSNCDLLM